MGGYTAKLARRIKEQGAGGSSPLILAEYVSPSAIRIGGELFSHNVHGNPQCDATAGDTVLAAQIGSSFYVICRRCDMGVFPFINTETVQEAASKKLPLFREYAYDFEKHCLKLDDDGRTYLVQGNEALRIWIYFALETARYRYTAYDTTFGSEIEEQLIGQPMNDEVTQMELERYTTEALMCNPYIEELSEFDFVLQKDGIKESFRCRSVYGEETIQHDIKAVR